MEPKRAWRRETLSSTFPTIRCARRPTSTTPSVARRKAARTLSLCALERGTAAFNSWRYPFPLNGQRFGAASRVGSVRFSSLHPSDSILQGLVSVRLPALLIYSTCCSGAPRGRCGSRARACQGSAAALTTTYFGKTQLFRQDKLFLQKDVFYKRTIHVRSRVQDRGHGRLQAVGVIC